MFTVAASIQLASEVLWFNCANFNQNLTHTERLLGTFKLCSWSRTFLNGQSKPLHLAYFIWTLVNIKRCCSLPAWLPAVWQKRWCSLSIDIWPPPDWGWCDLWWDAAGGDPSSQRSENNSATKETNGMMSWHGPIRKHWNDKYLIICSKIR